MAKYRVTLNNPEAGDVELEVPPIGLMKNGSTKTVELDAETAKMFRSKDTYGITIESAETKSASDKGGGE